MPNTSPFIDPATGQPINPFTRMMQQQPRLVTNTDDPGAPGASLASSMPGASPWGSLANSPYALGASGLAGLSSTLANNAGEQLAATQNQQGINNQTVSTQQTSQQDALNRALQANYGLSMTDKSPLGAGPTNPLTGAVYPVAPYYNSADVPTEKNIASQAQSQTAAQSLPPGSYGSAKPNLLPSEIAGGASAFMSLLPFLLAL